MNTFDGGDLEPLLIRCGHVTCRSCLLELQQKGSTNCPHCKAQWEGDISHLKVVKDLIPPGANITRRRVTPTSSQGANIQRRPLLPGARGFDDPKKAC